MANLTINGTSASETISGDTGNDVIYGGGGNDSLSGGGGNDALYGNTGSDTLFGGTGNDSLFGGDGNDLLLIGSNGNQYYDGGSGFDTFDASGAIQNIQIDLSTGKGRAGNNFTVQAIERVVGSRFADSITGSIADDVLEGGGGDDTVNGGDGNDTLLGGAGNDRLNGGTGADKLVYDAVSGSGFTHNYNGGAGTDQLELRLTSAQYTAAVQSEIASFKAFIANPANAGQTFTFNKVGFLQVSNVEGVRVLVDGADPLAPTNSAPVITAAATTSSLTAGHNSSVSGTIAATDANGDTLTYSVKTGPANGTVTFNNANGQYTYQAGDFVGSDSFVLQVSDGKGGIALQTVTVDVTNAGPAVASGTTTSLSVGHGKSVNGTIAATDADGDTLTYSVKTGPANGTVSFNNANGQYTYQAGDFVGSDSFVLQVSDGHGGVTTQTVTVDVTNTGPAVAPSSTTSLTVVHNQSVSGVIAATDGDGDSLAYSLKTGPAYGTVTFTDANGSYVYQAGDFVGTDSFTLQVSDGHGGLATQVVTITSTNTDPVVWPSSTTYFDVAHDQAYNAQIVATDPDGDTLTYSVLDAPTHGTITFTDDAGHYTYQAIGAFETDSFTLKVSDGHGGFATLTVNLTDPNTVPVVSAGSTSAMTVSHNASVAGAIAATDAENDPLTYSVQTGPEHGTVTFTDGNGNYVYSAGDYVGTDSFTLLVNDGYGGLVPHTVTVDVTNAGPTIAAGSTSSLSVAHTKTIGGSLAGLDADGDALSYTVKTGPANGTVTFNDANGNYTYEAGNVVGTDSFVLQVSDGHGGLAYQTVTVNVGNTGPVIGAGTTTAATVMQSASFAGSVVAVDAEGDKLSYSVQSGPKLGALQFTDANGHYSYTAGSAAGVDTFTLQVTDDFGGVATQTVNIGVIGTWDLTANSTSTVINLSTGTATGTSTNLLQYAIDVTGSGFADTITGDARDNVLRGGDGKDELHGMGGNDQVLGGTGDDKLFGEDGNDYLDGGDGVDAINGGAGNDTMLGGIGNDGFFGGGGQDLIYGNDGADRIYGDGGNDTIIGGAGNDTMTGGGTSATLAKGSNTFAWAKADVVNSSGASVGLDRITDFGVGDRMDFSGLFSSKPAVVSNVIHLTDTAAGTVVSAAVGAGGAFVDVVVLDGLHIVNVDDLTNAGQLVV